MLLQGFPISYANKVKYFVSNRHLLLQAGNAMTVNVIVALGKQLQILFQKGTISMKENEKFETSCYQYLCNTYGSADTIFTHKGKHDANVPDIEVSLSNGANYYIEAKMKDAQCGQFVLQPDYKTQTFIYTAKSKENSYTDKIKTHMNKYYNRYVNAGTSGEDIILDTSIFYRWVKEYYTSKNVKFFITQSLDYIIFPVNEFDKYFDISACYRCKRSGSSHPSKNNLAELTALLDGLHVDYSLQIGNSKNNAYVTMDYNMHKKYLQGPSYEYFFKLDTGNRYIVTRCSNTWNSNVIFQIKLKAEQNPQDLTIFKNSIL